MADQGLMDKKYKSKNRKCGSVIKQAAVIQLD
jgi:hypothetical protein